MEDSYFAHRALSITQRSILMDGLEPPPSGYTRIQVICGGYIVAPLAEPGASAPPGDTPRRSRMTYMNMLDPKGNIPGSVVKITVPERMLIISRIRGLLTNPQQWYSLLPPLDDAAG